MSGLSPQAAPSPGSQGAEPEWLTALRADGAARFERLGVPTTRREAWRYTSLRALNAVDFLPAPDASALPLDDPDSPDLSLEPPAPLPDAVGRVVFVGGVFDPSRSTLSDLPGLRVVPLERAVRDGDATVQAHLPTAKELGPHTPFLAQNDARFSDGALIHVARGAQLAGPVELVFVTGDTGSPAQAWPRVLVVAEPLSQLTVIERHTNGRGPGAVVPHLSTPVTHVVVGDGARVEHAIHVGPPLAAAGGEPGSQETPTPDYHLGTVLAQVGRDGAYASHTLLTSGAIARTEIRVRVTGPGAEVTLDGLYVPVGKEVHDVYTVIDHAVPHGRSDQVFKGLIAGEATGTYQGRVLIREGAVQSETHQVNHNLLLGGRARANTKPQLEIDNDDVTATHGSTVGQLDRDALFYLASRGVPGDVARGLLIEGFARALIDALPSPALADAVRPQVLGRLGASAGLRAEQEVAS